jgi:hypothetical protein
MVTLASNSTDCTLFESSPRFEKLHSRAREARTSRCAEELNQKSKNRIEIRLTIYDYRIRLESCSRDPIGYADGYNVYLYVGDRALSWTDPSGFSSYSANDLRICSRKVANHTRWMFRIVTPCARDLLDMFVSGSRPYGGDNCPASCKSALSSENAMPPSSCLASYLTEEAKCGQSWSTSTTFTGRHEFNKNWDMYYAFHGNTGYTAQVNCNSSCGSGTGKCGDGTGPCCKCSSTCSLQVVMTDKYDFCPPNGGPITGDKFSLANCACALERYASVPNNPGAFGIFNLSCRYNATKSTSFGNCDGAPKGPGNTNCGFTQD